MVKIAKRLILLGVLLLLLAGLLTVNLKQAVAGDYSLPQDHPLWEAVDLNESTLLSASALAEKSLPPPPNQDPCLWRK